ncbi:sigma-70 family RNA polymerase sigma factor [Candidatus Poribacteria bacterium]|nr:sigma-70 family RNA polymerase sigma factor [Candidatus Poribacteria bacterium]
MEKDDIELIHNILSGDETAFNVLVQKYQKSIHAIAWQRVGDFHVAEEITQDVFLQAYNKLSTLKDPNKFARWLYVITKRRCARWLQREKPTMQSLEVVDEATLEKSAFTHYVAEQREEAATEHRREVVKKLLEKLPDSQRTVVALYYFRDMTSEAISKFLGVSINTIKSRLRRARQRLKEEELMICETLGSIQPPIDLTDHLFSDSMEFKADTPYFQDEHTEYTGLQTVNDLMSAFDTEFDRSIIKISVGIVGGRSGNFTINEIDKRYPRTKWLQLILDNGLTIENFMHYASCLSKRHILAFLEDNPDFQKVNFFGIPPAQDDWNKYKTGFVREIIATEKMVRKQDEQKHKDEVTADSATE